MAKMVKRSRSHQQQRTRDEQQLADVKREFRRRVQLQKDIVKLTRQLDRLDQQARGEMLETVQNIAQRQGYALVRAEHVPAVNE